jgi:hypothetical protein
MVVLSIKGRSGEASCSANRLPLHLQENAASAKVENPKSASSAQQTLMQSAANDRCPPIDTLIVF